MSKKTITQILSGIEPALVEECAFYRPPSERNGMKKNKTRRAAVLILAACLAAALGVTAYATGALQSLISKYWGGIVYQTPDEQLREERPDYAQWLDEQRQTQSMMQRIGEEAVQTEETYSIPGLPGAGVTLLEYYYDGEKLSLACQFKSPEEPVDFSAQGMDGLLFQPVEEDSWLSYGSILKNPQAIQSVQEKLEAEGSLCFLALDAWLGDHVYGSEEDLGPCLGDRDENGVFLVDPIALGMSEAELPERCRNLPELTVNLTYRVTIYAYRLEGNSQECARVGQAEFPVYFTIPNLKSENIQKRWSLSEGSLAGNALHLSERIQGTNVTIDAPLPAVNTQALWNITLEEDHAAWQALGREVVMERFPQIGEALTAGNRSISLSEEGTGNLLLSFSLSEDGFPGFVGYLDAARDLNGSSLDDEAATFLPHYLTSVIPQGMTCTGEEACFEVTKLLERYSCFRFSPWNVRAEYDSRKQQGCYRIQLQPSYEDVPLWGQRVNTEAFYSEDGLFLCQGLLALKECQRTALTASLPLETAIEAFVNAVPQLTSREEVQCTAITQGYLASVQEETVTLSPAWVFACSGYREGDSSRNFQVPILMETGQLWTLQNGQPVLLPST